MKLKTNIGVYILWSDEKVVYIGKSIDIYTRMYQSIKERESEDTKINQYSIVETGSNFEACALEKMLIIENKPILNKEQYEKCFCNVIKSGIDINSLEKVDIEEELLKDIEKKMISREMFLSKYFSKDDLAEPKYVYVNKYKDADFEKQELLLTSELYNMKRFPFFPAKDIELLTRFIEEYIYTTKLLFENYCICESNISFSQLLLYLKYIISESNYKQRKNSSIIYDMQIWLFEKRDYIYLGYEDNDKRIRIEDFLTEKLTQIGFFKKVDIYYDKKEFINISSEKDSEIFSLNEDLKKAKENLFL